MKRFIAIAVVAAVLVAALASTALAAGPVMGRWMQQGTTPTTPGACPMGASMGGMGAGMMGGGMMGPAVGGVGRPDWAGQPDQVESLLGMTDAQIQAERQAGKSLAQIAASKGIGEDKLVETILSAKKAALQEAVTAGTLTQVQADQMIATMQTMTKTMVERTTTGPMMRGSGMRGGGMRGSGMRGGTF